MAHRHPERGVVDERCLWKIAIRRRATPLATPTTGDPVHQNPVHIRVYVVGSGDARPRGVTPDQRVLRRVLSLLATTAEQHRRSDQSSIARDNKALVVIVMRFQDVSLPKCALTCYEHLSPRIGSPEGAGFWRQVKAGG